MEMYSVWLKRLILLLVIMNGLWFFVHIFIISRTFSDGVYLNPASNQSAWRENGVLITVADSTDNELHNGDIVVDINGIPLSNWVNRLLCFSKPCPEIIPPSLSDDTQLTYTVLRNGETITANARLRPHPFWEILLPSWGGLAFAAVNYVVFTALLIKKPDDSAVIALALGSAGLFGSTAWLFGYQVTDLFTTSTFWLYRFSTEIVYLLSAPAVLHFALVFPDTAPFLRNRQWILVALYPISYGILAVILWLGSISNDNPLLRMAQFGDAIGLTESFFYIGALIALIYNYLRLKEGIKRRQVQIVAFTVVLVLGLSLSLRGLPALVFGSSIVTSNQMGIVGLIVPASIVFAIQRHRLWNIDPIINRALVYTGLSTIILAIYMLTVVLSGELLRIQTGSVSGLIATGIVAFIFQPLRDRLQKIVNRIMYGERDDPANVLSQLAIQLESADTSSNILPSLVQTIAQTLKIPYVAIWEPISEDQVEVIAEWGKPPEQREMFSLIYHNKTIGYLVVAPRSMSEYFTANEHKLLTTIAALTATTVRAVQLSDELRVSRQRIVAAREEERRRMRRDLHDGLGPQLASQTLGLEAIAQLMESDPPKAQSLIQSLQTQANDAIQDIRRLVYNLRPPALDDLGLVEALQQSICRYENNQLHIEFEVSDIPSNLPAAIETAIFRIAQEALTNVVRHSGATRCAIHLYRLAQHICIEIQDNGHGLPSDYQSGIGLQTMRERAVELNGETSIQHLANGGTLVKTILPIEVTYG